MANETTQEGGISAVSDTPELAPQAPPQVIVQMVTPTAGEATPGLDTTRPGGRYAIQDPDPNNVGKFITRYVDAEGQPLKGK